MIFLAKAVPCRAADDGQQRVGDVPGQRDVGLHLIELLGLNGGQRVFLRIHRALLQRKIDLGKGDGGGVGAGGFGEHHVKRGIGHADLQPFHVGGGHDRLVGRHVAFAVIGHGGDVVARGLVIAQRQFPKQVGIAVGIPMRVIAEHEGRAADGDGTVSPARKQLAGIDDVHRAKAQAFVDVGFLAQRGRREDLDAQPVVGGGHQRVIRGDGAGVIGFVGLVDMRPFQHALGLLCGCGQRCAKRQPRRGGQCGGLCNPVHLFSSLM